MISTFGDSIMRGVMSDTKKENGRPKYKISEQGFVSRCERKLGVKILNFSCFGSTTTQGMKYMEKYGSEVKGSNVAVFEYGGNDCDFDWAAVAAEPQRQHQPKVMLKRFVQQYNALIDSVKKMNIRPVILSMPVIDPDRFFETVSFGLNRDNILQWLGGRTIRISHWHEMYNLELFKIARQRNVPIVDITSPFLEQADYDDYLCADGIHPNERGHALIAEVLMSKAKDFPGLFC
ncbi:MAG: SGNH/GDSL hydrolase family protein [Bacteroidales bacterium]|nr:SGNH/GDSL hydrolase family protein [Bacteroidales bacterium]